MKIEQLLLKVELKADAPIAIRSGAPANPQGGAPLATDHRDQPYIPATTLKGALRGHYTGANADKLFGEISNEDGGGIGAISFDHGFIPGENPLATVKTSRRTAIDRQRGSAEHNKLFTTVAIDRGNVFSTQFAIGVENGDFDAAAKLLAEALAPLWLGIAVGSGQRQAHGTLRLHKMELEVQRLCRETWSLEVMPDDELLQAIRESIAKAVPSEAVWTREIKLTTDQVFVSIDSDGQADDRVQIRMARTTEKSTAKEGPLLNTTSVVGALRSRAAWLAELHWMRGGGKTDFVPNERSFDTESADQRDWSLRLGPGELSSVERLFGVPGWAGLLNFEVSRVDHGEDQRRVNIAIDRLSGGALRGALFHTEVSRLASWTVKLSIKPAPSRLAAWAKWQETDLRFLEILLNDLQANGLTLGHGASKGFGWMTVEDIAHVG